MHGPRHLFFAQLFLFLCLRIPCWCQGSKIWYLYSLIIYRYKQDIYKLDLSNLECTALKKNICLGLGAGGGLPGGTGFVPGIGKQKCLSMSRAIMTITAVYIVSKYDY